MRAVIIHFSFENITSMLYILAFLTSFIFGANGQSNFACPQSNGDFPNPFDTTCKSYYSCNEWNPSMAYCPSGMRFHPYPTARKCRLEDSVDCDGPNTYVCKEPTANEADPKNCSRFYFCDNGAPLHRTCPTGQIFMSSRKSCQNGDASQCSNSGAIFRCPEWNGNFPDASDSTCRRYFSCSNGEPSRSDCPLDYKFHPYPTMRRCLLPDSVDCNPKTPFICPTASGDFVDPNDCSRFYQCQNYAPLHRRCPQNQIFYEAYKNCSSGSSQQCANSGGSFVCPLNAYGNYEDPSDSTCRHYYVCSNVSGAKPTRVQCPNDFRFHPHPNMRRCLVPDSVDCKTPNPFQCPESTADFRDPNNCGRFYSCQNWVPLHRTCQPGTIFSDRSKRCETGDVNRCESEQIHDFPCPAINGKYADPSDDTCRGYYTCSNWKASRSECQTGFTFHPYPSLERCVVEDSYDCNDPNGPFKCPVEDGDVRDPFDCRRFYSCQKGAPLHRSCQGSNWVFSESMKRCVEPGSTNQCKGFSCSSTNGKFPDPNDSTCTHYFDCLNGSGQWDICPNGLRFHPHPNMRRCVLADSVDCGTTQFTCPDANVDVPDTNNDNRFYSCQNYVPLHRTCPAGLKFKNALKRCA